MTSDFNHLLVALNIAATQHKHQTRKSDGSPYINHLIEVAYLLTDVAGTTDQELLQAAVLHDILEDTETSVEELRACFTDRTLSLIEAVTDDKSLPLEARREAQIKHLSGASQEVKLLKLADHCSNIASIPDHWSGEKTRAYMEWSEAAARLCFDASEALATEYLERLKSVHRGHCSSERKDSA